MSVKYRNASGQETIIAGLTPGGDIEAGAVMTRSGQTESITTNASSVSSTLVTFDSPMPDTDYEVVFTIVAQTGDGKIGNTDTYAYNKTINGFNIITFNGNTSSAISITLKWKAIKTYTVQHAAQNAESIATLEAMVPAGAGASNKLVSASQLSNITTPISDAVDDIQDLIPVGASISNQLVTASQASVDSALSATSEHAVQNKVVKAALDDKQDALEFDTEPTEDSEKMVNSGAIYDALVERDEAIDNTKAIIDKNGSKNLIPNIGINDTIYEVEFTVDKDGVVTANGTATGGNVVYETLATTTTLNLPDGKYILSGLPAQGSSTTFRMRYALYNSEGTTDGWVYITDPAGAEITFSDVAAMRIHLVLYENYEATNFKFKPMLRVAEDTDNTYQPYAKTNQKLTEADNTIYQVMSKNGAKNYLNVDIENLINGSKVKNGVTITQNNDGSITLDGTASAWFFENLNYKDSGVLAIPPGTYKINGGIHDVTFTIYGDNNDNVKVLNETAITDKVFTIPSTATRSYVRIEVSNGKSFDNETFYPMVRLAEDTDTTFVPYAKTNKVLTEDLNETNSRLDAIDNFEETTKSVGYSSIVDVDDAIAGKAVGTNVKMIPSQDLNGYDHPWVGEAGKNLLPLTVTGIKAANTVGTWNENTYTLNNITITINTDNNNNVIGINLNGSPSMATSFYFLKDTSITLPATCVYSVTTNKSTGFLSNIDTSVKNGTISIAYGAIKNNDKTMSDTTFTDAYIYMNSNFSESNVVIYPMIRKATETDNTFEPYTNICPLSGWDTIELTRTSNNLFGGDKMLNVVKDTFNGTITDRTVRFAAANTQGQFLDFDYKYKENTQYTFIIKSSNGNISETNKCGTNLIIHYTDGTSQALVHSVSGATANVPYTSAFVSEKGKTIKGLAGTWYTNFTTLYVDNSGVFEGVLSVSDFEPYQGDTYTFTLDNTQYGGTLDVTTGVLTVTHKYYTLPATLNWTTWSAIGENITGSFMATLSDIKSLTACDKIKVSNASDIYYGREDYIIASNVSSSYKQICIRLDSSYDTIGKLQTFLTNTPINIAYEMQSSFTVQLTPTQVKLLQSKNILFSNCGDTKLTYRDNTIGNLGYTVGEIASNQFIDVTNGVTVKFTQNFTTSYTWTVPEDGWYTLRLQNNAADTGYALTIGLCPYGNETANYIINVTRTVGQAYDFAYATLPLKKNTKILYKYGNSSIQCQASAVRLYTNS